jgi:hypothetical protein
MPAPFAGPKALRVGEQTDNETEHHHRGRKRYSQQTDTPMQRNVTIGVKRSLNEKQHGPGRCSEPPAVAFCR